jgi:6-phosphofructokinase 1
MVTKLIAVATTGGDAPGMNAAIRAVARTAIARKLRVIGFERGYAGLLTNEHKLLDARAVGRIMRQGGTFLKTSRSDEMRTNEGISKASEVLKENGVHALVVIGGNGSLFFLASPAEFT